jgi:hypothetical protein
MRFSSDFYQIFVRYEIKWHTHQRGQKASDKPEKEEEAGADRRVYCDVERSFFVSFRQRKNWLVISTLNSL